MVYDLDLPHGVCSNPTVLWKHKSLFLVSTGYIDTKACQGWVKGITIKITKISSRNTNSGTTGDFNDWHIWFQTCLTSCRCTLRISGYSKCTNPSCRGISVDTSGCQTYASHSLGIFRCSMSSRLKIELLYPTQRPELLYPTQRPCP